MSDLKHKIEQLEKSGLSIQIEKEGYIIFQSAEPMLKPLYLCLNEKREQMNGATVIDKIVGQAAAYLCYLGQVREIFTPLASQSAEQFLAEKKILLRAARIIPQIMNRNNDGPCPMERLAISCGSPESFYQELQKRILARK
jgi:hypothetical protein